MELFKEENTSNRCLKVEKKKNKSAEEPKSEQKEAKAAEDAKTFSSAECGEEGGQSETCCKGEKGEKCEKCEKEGSASESEIEKLKAEAEDLKRKWYSVTAEYENYRKRTAFESARRYAEGRADVVKGLFPIADNLERALLSCKDEATKKGIEMVVTSFEGLLKEENIEAIDPLGSQFDAEKCEAIMALDPEAGEESGIVKQVYRKGYMQNGKVLRYAQVVVTK